MIEVYAGLHIGDERDYELQVKHEDGWRIVHACKDPYHRRELGYTGRGAPKDDPEYLIARRGHRLILNLVDAPTPAYIPKEIIDAALEFIQTALQEEVRVLVHCNQGESRSPGIGLLYLARFTDVLPLETLEAAENSFRSLYPRYNPGGGMRGFMALNWDEYASRS